ncbi:hypothetical protein CGCF413_v008883 [Colletotrichum fructicola]|nr:hypothetical protein CGCF413_v008883 [Colletotrichum fructicola]
MEWTSPGAQQTRFNMGSSMSHAPQQQQQEQQNDGMELDELSPAGPGVSNLIARFEGIRAAPPSSSKVTNNSVMGTIVQVLPTPPRNLNYNLNLDSKFNINSSCICSRNLSLNLPLNHPLNLSQSFSAHGRTT